MKKLNNLVLEKLEMNLENASKVLDFDFGKGVGTLEVFSKH